MRAFEFHVSIGCPIQRRRTAEQFFSRAAIRALGTDKSLAGRGDDEFTFDPPVQTLMGAKSLLTGAEVTKLWQRLEKKSLPQCGDCPANFQGGAFGCYGSVSAPVSAQGERWLVESFTPASGVESTVPAAIIAAGVTGSEIDIRRGVSSDGVPLTEAMEPARKTTNPGNQEFSSSQLLEFILSAGPILKSDLQFAFLADFGAIDLSSDEILVAATDFSSNTAVSDSAKIARFREKVRKDHAFRFGKYSSDDQSVTELKQFFRACYLALTTGGKVMVRTEFSLA